MLSIIVPIGYFAVASSFECQNMLYMLSEVTIKL